MNNLEKEFVPYEIALELKELGFNEPCFGYYYGNKTFSLIKQYEIGVFDTNSTTNRYDGHGERPTAILYQQAFRYLYKKLKIKGSIPIDSKSQVMFLKELIEKLKLNK